MAVCAVICPEFETLARWNTLMPAPQDQESSCAPAPFLPYPLQHRLDWARWVTPKSALEDPLHRWFLFPHSFSAQLVDALLAEWALAPGNRLLDPFVGTGTTLLCAKSHALDAVGYDLSPLAVFASNTKTCSYTSTLLDDWSTLASALTARPPRAPDRLPTILRRALPGRVLDVFMHIRRAIGRIDDPSHRSFFMLALVAILPRFSKAQRTGGWLRWTSRRIDWRRVLPAFRSKVSGMLVDLEHAPASGATCRAFLGDARSLPRNRGRFDALVTSPPYPNRHDYSRMFNVELAFGFLDESGISDLRAHSFRSHVEAHDYEGPFNGYCAPPYLNDVLSRLEATKPDPRIPHMLKGYFQDIYLSLKSATRVLKPGAPIAYVLGNVRYSGITVPVDQLVACVGASVGLDVESIIVARYRGNSAQQMGTYGREPSRESVVVLRTPAEPEE